MEYDTTSHILSVALRYSIKNNVVISSKSLDLFHRTRGFMLLQMTETWVNPSMLLRGGVHNHYV